MQVARPQSLRHPGHGSPGELSSAFAGHGTHLSLRKAEQDVHTQPPAAAQDSSARFPPLPVDSAFGPAESTESPLAKSAGLLN